MFVVMMQMGIGLNRRWTLDTAFSEFSSHICVMVDIPETHILEFCCQQLCSLGNKETKAEYLKE